MGFADAYLGKQHYKKNSIAGAAQGLLQYIIIIPAYCEPEIICTLQSIQSQTEIPRQTEVIILFNFAENDSATIKEENEQQFNEVKEWCSNNPINKVCFHPLIIRDLPYKIAGAGMARKVAMDLAVERFNQIDQPEGVILSVDADTLLPADYLLSVEKHLQNSPNTNTFIFNFEHGTEGVEFNPEIYQSAILYELHLRYYRMMLEKSGFPYPYFTVGSCFGVKARLYSMVGGMNRRKAGEDFYFLQKIFPFGHVAFLNRIVLRPSSRPSWRVPFGTGPAIRKIVESNMSFKTYNPKAFEILKDFFNLVPSWFILETKACLEQSFRIHNSLQTFLKKQGFEQKLHEIKGNSSNVESFTKRFFSWFNAFIIIKFLNYSKENQFPEIEILEAVKLGLDIQVKGDKKELLEKLRAIDLTG